MIAVAAASDATCRRWRRTGPEVVSGLVETGGVDLFGRDFIALALNRSWGSCSPLNMSMSMS